ncbi:hypothetical protein ABT013_19550 [Streptomyces bacillaris]|uniref:hypothetical protein n=1 Tax=Streptomyces TaxID=1883 RepID=UPI0002E8EC7F|nr:hypothetical protein [Streptomyces sp. OUCMDZ-4982]MCR8944296.1 hypothetical protein [Streptomyces sp. OUCMDZ-4982]MYR36505.1 hypothetical protein [Streptomyces sp. SID4944]
MMRRQIKLAAVLVVVVLALTGFSTSSSGGKGSKSKGSSSSGGGCSNSKKSNSGYRHNDYSDDDNSSSGSSGSTYGTPTPTASDDPVVRVIRCARPGKGKRKAVTASVVELRSNDTRSHRYEVDVTFLDARGNTVDTAETTTTLDAGDVRSLTVRMDSPRKVSQVSRCEVTAQLL